MTGENAPRPIAVVGCPRSGTTWVGDVLATDPDVHQFYEPFNRLEPDPLGGHRWPFRGNKIEYLRVDADAPEHVAGTDRFVRQRIPLSYFGRPLAGTLIPGHRTPGEWFEPIRAAARHRLRHQRVLAKDPLATFLVPWLVTNFDFRVVFMTRHPCGVAAGVKRMRWEFRAEWILADTDMMADLLEPVRGELEIAA